MHTFLIMHSLTTSGCFTGKHIVSTLLGSYVSNLCIWLNNKVLPLQNECYHNSKAAGGIKVAASIS